MNLPWRRSGQSAAPSAPPAAVLLASPGRPFSDQAVDTAVTMANGQPIRVLTIAKIYGTSLGLQNPWLLPSKREMQEQRDIVADAIRRIKRTGGRAQGEVVATRNNAKTFLRAARRYSVRHVVLEPAGGGRLRKLAEGDPSARLRRRLGGDVTVHVVDRPTANSALLGLQVLLNLLICGPDRAVAVHALPSRHAQSLWPGSRDFRPRCSDALSRARRGATPREASRG